MSALGLGLAVLVLLIWLGRKGQMRDPRRWRAPMAVLALAAIVAGAALSTRGNWLVGFALAAAGLALATQARRNARETERQPDRETMSETEARALLGVGPEADAAEIRAAYGRLIRMAHPDAGGTTGLARQLNAARDRLLKR